MDKILSELDFRETVRHIGSIRLGLQRKGSWDELIASHEMLRKQLAASEESKRRMREAFRHKAMPKWGNGCVVPGVCGNCGLSTADPVHADINKSSRSIATGEMAYCEMHGTFYSGYLACPTCAALKERDAEAQP